MTFKVSGLPVASVFRYDDNSWLPVSGNTFSDAMSTHGVSVYELQ